MRYWIAIAIGLSMSCPSGAHAAAAPDSLSTLYNQWDEVSLLRAQGKYSEAVAALERIIAAFKGSDEVLREAYNQIVFTRFVEPNEPAARQQAMQALEVYPDLTADGPSYPPGINAIYESLRREMFGMLVIPEPKDGRAFLDGEYIGTIPLRLDLVRAGRHEVKATKSGYFDLITPFEIVPDDVFVLDQSLERDRDTWWYVKRVGVGVAAASLVWIAVDDSGTSTTDVSGPTDLPGAPEPPVR
jgi:hypothetical protein